MTASSSPTTWMSQHEQVVFCHDRTTGLRAIIGDLQHGPRAGPGRHPVLPVRQRGRGAGRRAAPVQGDGLQERGGRPRPRRRQGRHHRRPGDATRRRDLLRAYGRFVESLGGRYVTACDVGTYVADMDIVSETTRFATGRSEANGGAGRLLRAHRLRRVPGHARSGPAPVGAADPRGPHGRHRRRRQGRTHPRRAPARRRGRGRGDRRQRAGPGRARRPAPRDRGRCPTRRPW